MSDTLVDTNVLLDVNGEPSEWQAWSERQIAEAAEDGGLVINQVIYSELAIGYGAREELEEIIERTRLMRENLPWGAAYIAGHAFVNYRRRGGSRALPLPDFFIGAHAAVRGYTLLTRDRGYYATYFPTLKIISPETQP
ncbi:MAG: type II toxin-antitoxin system VapC family toxin [Bauldia sp.]